MSQTDLCVGGSERQMYEFKLETKTFTWFAHQLFLTNVVLQNAKLK